MSGRVKVAAAPFGGPNLFTAFGNRRAYQMSVTLPARVSGTAIVVSGLIPRAPLARFVGALSRRGRPQRRRRCVCWSGLCHYRLRTRSGPPGALRIKCPEPSPSASKL